MKPQQLTPREFSSYPPLARQLASDHFVVLSQVPLSLLPTLLRDIQDYDWKFPPEQREIEARLRFLHSKDSQVEGFAKISVPETLTKMPWVKEPQYFIEAFTAYLWSSGQMDAYRGAATEFVQRFNATFEPVLPAMPRLIVIAIGRDAKPIDYPLFQKLSSHGQILSQVEAESAVAAVLRELQNRAQRDPEPYVHWYLDGGSPLIEFENSAIAQLSYSALAPVNRNILNRMIAGIQSGTGPEVLRTALARLSPEDLSADKVTDDPHLQHFAVSLLTEASGTQIFSTSFVQWAAREILRRAQPVTLFVRFAPRQRQQAFNAMVHAASGPVETDPEGSLIDADMGAYYTYLEMKKLPASNNATFVVWVEGQSNAFVSGGDITPGTRSDRQISLDELIGMHPA